MAKRVFFSFHYQDVIDFRANIVRNHWRMKPDRDDAGFFDASVWEESKKQGDVALKRLINKALDNTSNTCVLVGSHTFERPWVRYEILKSFLRGNHLLAVHVNCNKGKDQQIKPLGRNPFEYVGVTYSSDGKTGTLWEKTGNKWVEYDKIDGSAHFVTSVGEKHRSKGYNFSHFYSLYDWVENDGYNKFPEWLK